MSTDPTDPTEAYVFDHIPELDELMRKTAGLPGVTYAQITTGNAKKAQNGGWLNVLGGRYYTVDGPKGRADMVLMASGVPIPGCGHDAGARECLLDPALFTLTGFPNPNAPQVPNPKTTPQPSSGKSAAAAQMSG